MNTLLAHPIPSLIHAFPAKNCLGTLGSHRCLGVPAKPLSRDPRLPAWHNYSSQSFGASSILLFKAAGCWHAKNRYASKIAPCLVCASSRTVLFPDALATSGVGFVQPSSRSPRSPHLKSHSRQRRPTRLQVMWGKSLGQAKFLGDFEHFAFGVNKEAAGIHVLPSRSLFACDILRRFLRRVSLAKSSSAPLRF